jgi:hypothetical protein
MMYEQRTGTIRRDEHVIYTIELQGAIDPTWAEAAGGMAIEVHCNAHGVTVTRLHGELADQAALAGVLNLAFILGMPVLSVACIGKGTSSESA